MRLLSKGLGWFPREDDERDYSFDDTGIVKAESYPQKFSLLQDSHLVFDQGRANSCVLQAIGWAIYCKIGVVPSRLFGYYHSRWLHGAQKKDIGTNFRSACRGIQKFGLPNEKYWPYSLWKVNSVPSIQSYMMGHARKALKYAFIQRNQIKSVLLEGYPVVFGTQIDKSFLSKFGSSVADTPMGKTIGGHAMTITGWRNSHYQVLNSWGKYWRNGGAIWFTQEYIDWGHTRDFCVLYGW